MKLRPLLQGCATSQLARIAAAQGLRPEAGTLRRELVELIAGHLEAASQNAATWEHLSGTQRGVVGGLVRAGGRHEAELLTRRLTGDIRNQDEREAAVSEVQAAVSSLLERGVLFRIFEAEEQRQGVYLVLPDELLLPARSQFGAADTQSGPPPVQPPTEVARCDVADDLFVLASALRREAWSGPSRGLAGRPPRSVGQILARLRAATPPGPGQPGQRWRFLLWLAQRATWINRDLLPRPDDDSINRLLRDPATLPGKALAAGPARTEGPPARGPQPPSARPRHLQADTLQLLSELPDGQWWLADDLASWLTTQLPDRADGSGTTGGRPARPEQHTRTIVRWLAGRWFWLGLVTWGRTPAGWFAVRPTAALRTLVTGRVEQAATPPFAPCTLAGDLTLTAPHGVDLAALYRTEPYLAYAGSDATGRHYRLTPPSLERGLRLGGSPEVLAQLLAQLTEQPVSDAWSTKISQWTTSDGRLRLSAGLILSSDDEGVLADALALPAASESVVELLSPTQARVAGERLAAMLADLAAAGLPVDIDPGVRAEPAQLGRAAALSGSAAEAAWIGLEIARRLAPELVDGQRDLTTARLQLEAIFSAARLEALGRRVASIMATASDRKQARPRRRVV